MTLIIQDSRLKIKQCNFTGVEPTIPLSDDHTDGTWLTTDIYPGELFINVVDEKVWFRGSVIQQIYPASTTSSKDVFSYANLAAFPVTGAVDKLYIAKDTKIGYFWNSGTATYDVMGTTASVSWSSITGGPASTPGEIDLTVAASHGINDVNTSHYTKLENDAAAGNAGAKQDKEAGKGLSENDFTDYYKGILDAGIEQVIIEDDEVSFPIPGSDNVLYIARITKTIYIWNVGLGAYETIINGGTGARTLYDLTDVVLTLPIVDGQILTYDLASNKWINDYITRTEGDDHYILWRDQQTNTNKTTYLQYSEENGRMMLNPGTYVAMEAEYSLGIEDKITNDQALGGQINLDGLNLYIKGSSVGSSGGQVYGLKVEALPEKDGDISAGVYIRSGWGLHGDQYPMRIETPSMGTGKILTCLDGITGYVEWSDPTGITGSGTVHYLPMYDASGTNLVDSMINCTGDSLKWYGLPTPKSGNYFSIIDTDNTQTNLRGLHIDIENTKSTGFQQTIGANIKAVTQLHDNACYGLIVSAENLATGGFNTIVGAQINASSYSADDSVVGLAINVAGTAVKHGLSIVDGTEGAGKVLTSDIAGKATWAAASGGITGSGTLNYISKWSSSTGLSKSMIQDDGTRLAIGTLNYESKFALYTSSQINGMYVENAYLSTPSASAIGIDARSLGAGSSFNIAVLATALGCSGENIGVSSSASGVSGTNIAGSFTAGNSAIANYALQLSDGSESTGKVLTCVTSDGKANWSAIPSNPFETGTVMTGVTGTVVLDEYTYYANDMVEFRIRSSGATGGNRYSIINAHFTASTVEWTETGPSDIGDSSDLSFGMALNNSTGKCELKVTCTAAYNISMHKKIYPDLVNPRP